MFTRTLLLTIFLLLPLTTHAASLTELLQRIAPNTSQTLSFTETRHTPLMAEPLVSSGTVSFTPPDRFEKHTIAPLEELITLSGNKLTIKRREAKGYRIDRIALEDHPALQGYLGSVRALLKGDETALLRYFTPTLTEKGKHWQLTLTPTTSEIQKHLTTAIIAGSSNHITRMQFNAPDGGDVVMEIRR